MGGHARAGVGRRPPRARRAGGGHLGRCAGDRGRDRAVPRADARHPRRPEVARRRLLRRRTRRRAARGPADRPRHRPHQLPDRARAGRPVRSRPPAGRGAVRRRPVRGGVVPRLPGRQAGAALRRQHLPRAVGGDEPPRRRARPRRHRRRARDRHRRRHHRRHVVGLALPGAAPAGAGRADPDVVGGRDRADHLRPRRLPRRDRAARSHHPPAPSTHSAGTGSGKGRVAVRDRVEGLVEVGDEVVGGLDADRQADERRDRPRAASRPPTRGSSAPGAR